MPHFDDGMLQNQNSNNFFLKIFLICIITSIKALVRFFFKSININAYFKTTHTFYIETMQRIKIEIDLEIYMQLLKKNIQKISIFQSDIKFYCHVCNEIAN